jgi:photosystem II stability/assembly factor-like uncharacterized protein
MKKYLHASLVLFISLIINTTFAQSGWISQTNPLGTGDSAILGKVQFVSPTEGWISGGRGDLLHTTDAGNNWMVVTPFPDDSVWCSSDPAVSMSWVNQTHGWKINSFGPDYGISYGVVIHQTTDAGNTWQKKVLSNVEGDFGFQIQFVDINNGWLLYFNFSTQVATFLKTTDGGNNWFPFNGAGIFYFVDANIGWSFYGSGQNGSDPPFKILHTTNGGADWSEQFSDNVAGVYHAIYFSDTEHGWITGDNGKVIKTIDGGSNWNFVTNSGINPNERSKSVFFLNANIGWISSKDNAGHAFIQHTTDGGVSWTTQGNLLNNGSIYSIYFYDAQNGWITGNDSEIRHYSGTSAVDADKNIPTEFLLSQNYPNPFNPSTKIKYSIPEESVVKLTVYSAIGEQVAEIVNQSQSAGTYEVEFSAKSVSAPGGNAGSLPSGIYFYRLKAGDYLATRKMILMK